MMDRTEKIIAISHGYTQQMRGINGTDKWVGRVFYDHSEVVGGEGTARKLLRIEGNSAVMEITDSDGVVSETVWSLDNLIYRKAVTESIGFVDLHPSATPEDCIFLMVDPNGHGYGHLVGDDSL
jgi:hypothetical protein